MNEDLECSICLGLIAKLQQKDLVILINVVLSMKKTLKIKIYNHFDSEHVTNIDVNVFIGLVCNRKRVVHATHKADEMWS